MKKHLVSVILAFCVLMTSALALTREQINTADALNSLGLFNGTDQGYQLSSQLNRSDGSVLLVRLLGKEAEAKSGNYTHPFTDVADWFAPHAAYAYSNGYIKGVTATRYASDSNMSRSQFYTLVLRALGYTDSGETPDFTWDSATAFAETIGLTDRNMSQSGITRGDAIEIFWNALDVRLKGEGRTLCDKLLADGVFTAEEFDAAKKIQSNLLSNEGKVVNERTGNFITRDQLLVEKAALAYWDKRADTDYDQNTFLQATAYDSARPSTRYENRSQPEWASPEHRLFLGNAAFCFAVYHNVYGEDIAEYIRWDSASTIESYAKSGKTDDIVYYYEFTDRSAAEKEKVASEVLALLEPGDIICYSTQAIMYLDGGVTLEAAGNSYNASKGYDNIDPEGAVKCRDIGYFFDLERSTNILSKSDTAAISIIRLLNVLDELDPLPRAEARLETSRLSLSKLCVAPGQTVAPSQTLTFKIVLDNQPETEKSKDLVLNVTDPLPTNVKFVKASHGGTLENGVLTWKDISVKDGEVKTLSYEAVVTAQEGFVESGSTVVNGIDFVYRPLQIGKKMTDAQFAVLKSKIDEGLAEGQSAEEFINKAYNAAVGTDLSFSSVTDVIGQLFSPQGDNAGVPRYYLDIDMSTKLGQGAVYNYVWGRRVLNMTEEEYKTRTRYVFEESFQKGDLLISQDMFSRGQYSIYLGEGNGFVCVSNDGIKNKGVSETLQTIPAQRIYAIIRPSMI